MNMTKRVVIVTGGGQGLGQKIAEQLVEGGYRVAIFGRTESKLKMVSEASGGAILPVTVDLSDADQVRSAFRVVDEAFGGVDILINNAASYLPVRIDEASDDEIALMVGANILSSVYCMREAIPRMRVRGAGDILTISSESVRHPPPYLSLYAGAKAAVETICAGLRHEVHGQNIRVMVFRSGQIASDQTPNMPPDKLAALLKAFNETGFAAKFMAGAAPADTLAAMVVHALATPRTVSPELIEMRPTPGAGRSA
jgi:NADP-dependent 3-hydroxy acid dehydrogenase YdfG